MSRTLSSFKIVSRYACVRAIAARQCALAATRPARPPARPLVWGTVSVLSAALLLHNASIVHLDAPASVNDGFEIDPATAVQFPKTLHIPSKLPLPPHSLVGIGVRTVSFLGVKVYSVGFYADLANPKLNIPVTATSEEKIEYIIRNTSCVLRIVPTRNTSYSHLRDGFVRAITARLQHAKSRGTLSPEMELAAQSPLRQLKSIFPTTTVAKGYPLDIHLTAPTGNPKRSRSLVFLDLGVVEGDWVAEQFVMAYFEGDGISPALKRDALERLKTFGK